jgi:hypothetical protein
MFVQGFGEVLTDVMTVNPAIADIPSASSILDTSNYTFQAVTFGKDAGGFVQHSHAVSTVQYIDGDSASGVSGYDSGILSVINYGSDLPAAASAASSYVISSTYAEFSSSYNSVPNDPSPLDTRLERGSTLSTNLSAYSFASALPDLGHYANAVLDSQLSAIWNKVGAFAPSSGGDYRFYDKDGSYVYSGTITSYFNTNGLVDKDGYLTVGNNVATNSPSYSDGAALVSSVSFPISEGKLFLNANIDGDDAMTLAAFGSVKHLGVYCLDMCQMLSEGLMPPYSWDALNNNRKYKLVAKSTILDDPLFHRDALGLPGFGDTRRLDTLLRLIFDFK